MPGFREPAEEEVHKGVEAARKEEGTTDMHLLLLGTMFVALSFVTLLLVDHV